MFSNLSALPENSKGRLHDEINDHRSLYERDRDRIYHSTAFRKLKDKTQVFMFEKGDYYRNRLTHTLEVSQIARSISRKLSLNEDLTECIALSHDLGHSPFGHVGEEIITQELDANFNHNYQSFRQITLLEKRYINFDGLNLTWETIDGLIKHNGKIQETNRNYDLSKNFKFDLNKNPSLEAQIASLSDDIAYIAHDFDDALRSGILTISSLAENKEQFNFIDFSYIANLDKSIARNYFTRSIMNYLILDLLNETENTLSNNSQIRSIEDVITNTNFLVKFSPPVLDKVKFLKNFLFEFFYTSDFVYKNRTQAEKILVSIIKLLNNDTSMLPSKWKEKLQHDTDKQQIIVDYVCGMTDQYAINFYKKGLKSGDFYEEPIGDDFNYPDW